MGADLPGLRGHQPALWPCARESPEARFHLTPPTMPSTGYHPTWVSVGARGGEGSQTGSQESHPTHRHAQCDPLVFCFIVGGFFFFFVLMNLLPTFKNQETSHQNSNFQLLF